MGQETFIDRIHATPAVKGHGRLNDVPEHFDIIRKRSDTYVAYIDLYRSIGWLGNPLLYRS